MKKKLKTSGNGWELYFSKPLLKLLGYNPIETKLLITARTDSLVIEPFVSEDKDILENSMVRGFQKSGSSGYGLYFPNPLIEYLELNPDKDYIDITIDKNKIMIKKAEKEEL